MTQHNLIMLHKVKCPLFGFLSHFPSDTMKSNIVIFQRGGCYKVDSFYYYATGQIVNVFLENGKCVTIDAKEATWRRQREDACIFITKYSKSLLNNFKMKYYGKK